MTDVSEAIIVSFLFKLDFLFFIEKNHLRVAPDLLVIAVKPCFPFPLTLSYVLVRM